MPKKPTVKELEARVEAYFDSITRLRTLTEGEEPVYNRLGETVEVVEYLLPPTEHDLCLHLGISTAQWREYGRPGSPPLRGVTGRARARIWAWCMRELLTKPGKDLKGLELYMQKLELTEGGEPEEGREELSLEERLRQVSRMLGGGSAEEKGGV
ncbi:MAG: DNA-packaging protein [Oscillospiraceae bacterium]|nr:DNA-packaging protein [Oscillospiraceae bacterium]